MGCAFFNTYRVKGFKFKIWFCYFLLAISCQSSKEHTLKDNRVNKELTLWLTTPDQSSLFQKQGEPIQFENKENDYPTITVDPNLTYQTIDGFGYTLTGGSAMLINKMDAEPKAALLKKLFSTEDNGIGVSYLRLSIGASDLDDRTFSYNDLPPGEKDLQLLKFSIDPDKEHLIPVLKEILKVNKNIMIMGSPWSPPAWMKTNNNTRGGSLKPEFFEVYANYFVKYIHEMKKEGITIDAITIQNEPLHPLNKPSLLMHAEDQASFIKNHLGPVFEKANIITKIIIYDHNADRPDYPIAILNDPEAKKFVDGSAFHLYGGSIESLSEVHKAHPDRNIYFTEQWIGAPGNFSQDVKWHINNLIIGASRNWSRNVLEWNLAADPDQRPHTDGGCTECLGALTIENNKVIKNPAYYIIAHASKFVRPGSVRIDSNLLKELPNVAFKAPDGNTVLIVLNDSQQTQSFNILHQGTSANTQLPAGAVGTFVW